MAIFTEAYCMQLIHETSQNVISELLEGGGNNSFINFELSPMEVQRICEECKNYHLSISESYLLEGSGPKASDLSKIGIKNANGKLTKASKDIAETIKKKGVSSESRKQIHNIISDLFKDLADDIDTSVIKNYPGLQSDNKEVQRKIMKSLTLLGWCMVVSILTQMVLTAMLGVIGQYLMIIVAGPIIEESCKAIAVKGNFEKEYNLVFNAFEFTEYIASGAPVKGRIAVVAMHSLTTAINKVFSTEAFRKKFGISDDKDSKDKCTLASFIIGNIIHVSWNAAAVFSPAFNAILS